MLLSPQFNPKLVWIPGHVGLSGNEKADLAAKSALTLPIRFIDLPFSDYKPCITSFISNKWQASWDLAVDNKLHAVKPTLGISQLPMLPREDEVAISRIRLGHSKLTHSFIFNRLEAPFCVGCDKPFTLHHILTDCVEFSHIRPRFYSYDNVFDIFQKIPPTVILNFFREILLLNRL